MEWIMGDYLLSDDQGKVDVNKVHIMLSKTYWASHRTSDIIHNSIKNSLSFGIYINNEQIGFARVITDEVVFSWICDVVIDESFRGKGLGKWMMKCIIEHPRVKNTIQNLSTFNAHGIYEKFGFIRNECMKTIP